MGWHLYLQAVENKKSLLKFPPLVKAVEEKKDDQKLVYDGSKF